MAYKKASTRQQFPAAPFVANKTTGKKVAPRRVVQKPDRTLSRIRQEAHLE